MPKQVGQEFPYDDTYTPKTIPVYPPRALNPDGGTVEVEALCVGGVEGVFAVHVDNRGLAHFYMGDDGTWREIATYDRHWLSEISGVLYARSVMPHGARS